LGKLRAVALRIFFKVAHFTSPSFPYKIRILSSGSFRVNSCYTPPLLLTPEQPRPKGIGLFVDETAVEIDKDMLLLKCMLGSQQQAKG
jgi:hypothetical protein